MNIRTPRKQQRPQTGQTEESNHKKDQHLALVFAVSWGWLVKILPAHSADLGDWCRRLTHDHHHSQNPDTATLVAYTITLNNRFLMHKISNKKHCFSSVSLSCQVTVKVACSLTGSWNRPRQDKV